ncbi:MAG: sugar ABC transporter substrate-binding protein [Spirochaetes bacterium]|nr:MAG: sugar ABC transporter substrate-binding protein [Spirochaetota bacterium]
MRERKILLIAVLFLLFVPRLFAAPALIAFSVSTSSNPFYATMVQGVKDEAAALGLDVIILDAQNKIEKQMADVEDALTKNIKVLLINGVDDGAINLAKKALGRGIPVMALQRNLGAANMTAFIGTNNTVLGDLPKTG